MLVAAFAMVLASPSGAAAADVGLEGASYSGASTPTGTKRAESVLWWNDGFWWASMWDTASQDFHIFRLATTTQTWVDTGVPIDTRSSTHSDVLWDGNRLYVASHKFASDESPAVAGYPSYLYRFSYDPSADRYSLDSGFPVVINDYKTETLVIEKDSTGKLWATWMQENKIYVNRTVGDDRTWGTPFVLPVAGTSVTVDDNSSLVAFGGDRIGLMWSNQVSGTTGMWFAVHVDGQPDTSWQPSTTAVQGSGTADDHINLKALRDGSGDVFAAVKTEHYSSSEPLVTLLVRDGASGQWSDHVFGRVSECHNRPSVVIDEERRLIHMLATGPAAPNYSCTSTGGAIYEKTSPLDAISFPSGYGTPVIQDGDSAAVHNASSTKQNVTSGMGLAVLAVNTATNRYWHHYDPLAPPGPPTADFSATPTAGEAPLTVRFTDLSGGSPSSWSWAFGDGSVSSERNPTHTYAAAGTYTVSLTVTNASGTDTETRVDYIAAAPPAPDFSVSASPASRTVVRGSSTSYALSITPTNGFTGLVDLAVEGLPAGASASFSPNPVDVPASTSSTLTIATSSTMKNGTYTLVVTGVSGGLSRTTSVSLQVKRR